MRRGRLQCRPASASSVRKYGFSSEKPFGKLLAQTCKRLVLGVFSFFCHLFFLFSPLSKEKESEILRAKFAEIENEKDLEKFIARYYR